MGQNSKRNPIEETEKMRNLLSFLLVGAFISCLPVFTFKAIPEANEQLITYMVGQLSGMATMALGFYFVNKVGQDAQDAKRAENTGKMADAVIAAATGKDRTSSTSQAVDDVAGAAQEKADEIKEEIYEKT